MSREKQYGDYRSSHQGRGDDYDESFEHITHRRVVWRLEKSFLADVVRRFFPSAGPNYLDFACGTGRVIAFMEPRVAASTGVDIAASMLDVARRHARLSQLVEGDLTRGMQLDREPFDLVTAFRFFPNAEPELRAEVFAALAAKMKIGGLLVFNNHLNWSSIVLRLLRLLGKPYGFEGVRGADLLSSARAAGFEPVARYHCGVLPVIDQLNWLPEGVLMFAETLLSRLPWLSGAASDVVYVVRRAR